MSNENNTMTEEQMRETIAALQAENKKLKAVSHEGLSFRVSQKGGVSVYGIQRFPVTLYKEQWRRLTAVIVDGSLGKFIDEADARGELRDKPKKEDAKPAEESGEASSEG